MSTALADTSRTLRRFLEVALAPFLLGARVVSLNSPVEMQDNNQEGLSVWLYRIERDPELLNSPPQRLNPSQLAREPLPLRLHYLVTPILVIGNSSTETEQEMLGRVLQAFHDQPLLEGGALQGGFAGTDVQLRVRFEPMDLGETAKLRDMLKLDNPYELSISYEVTVVNIESRRQPLVITPVAVLMPEVGIIVGRETN